MIEKIQNFANRFIPPILVIALMVPLWILHIIVYWTIHALLVILVPFEYNDKVECWWKMNFHHDDHERVVASWDWAEKFKTEQ